MGNTIFFQQLSANYQSLSEAEKEVIDYIIQCEEVEKLKIKMIEKKLFISSTTVVRACKKLGYSTFNAFKYALINNENMRDYQDAKSTYEKIVQTRYVDIERTLKLLEEDKVLLVTKQLLDARQVFCVATGSSTVVARDFSHKLKLIDILADDYTEKFPLEYLNVNATRDDVIIVFSLSGEDEALNQRLLQMKANGTVVIAITNLSPNALVTVSNLTLFVYSSKRDETKLSSQVSLHIACDVMFEMLMRQKS